MASAKATTRKLTGRAKDNFFDAGLSPEEAKKAVTSLQVRKEFWPVSKDLSKKQNGDATTKTRKAEPRVAEPSTLAKTKSSSPPANTAPPETKPLPETATPAAEGTFDPFVFGLVPVFKREGAEGLTARLNEIEDVENMRAMAKAQQIVLPREVRRGEASIETVRAAVLTAVEQRVSDRKAQL